MREIVSLAVGQCGNQVNYKFWETLAKEHGIDTASGQWDGRDDVAIQKSNVYFNEVDGGRHVPRSVLIDLEPGVLNSVRSDKSMGSLFNPDNFIGAQNGAGNNWAKGYYSDGTEIIEEVLDQVRRSTELCDRLQAFQLMHSIGGGTGSGLGSLLLEKLSEDYSDKLAFTFSVFPGSTNSGVSDVVVEPYNSILTLNSLIESSSATFNLDNSALNRICQNNLKIKQPSFADVNHIVAQVMSNCTATLRFPGFQNNCDIRKLTTNLVPFDRLHFIVQGQAPLFARQNQKWEKMGVSDIASQMFDARCFTSDVGDIQSQGKILTGSCLFRGSQISSYEVDQTVSKYQNQKNGNFVEWIPDNLMTSICKVPAATSVGNGNGDVSGTFLANTSGSVRGFQRLLDSFDKMYKAKAYTHWYEAEGMGMDEFVEAAENVRDLIAEYQQYEAATVEEDHLDDDEMEDMEEACQITSTVKAKSNIVQDIISYNQKLGRYNQKRIQQDGFNSSLKSDSTQACSDHNGSL